MNILHKSSSILLTTTVLLFSVSLVYCSAKDKAYGLFIPADLTKAGLITCPGEVYEFSKIFGTDIYVGADDQNVPRYCVAALVPITNAYHKNPEGMKKSNLFVGKIYELKASANTYESMKEAHQAAIRMNQEISMIIFLPESLQSLPLTPEDSLSKTKKISAGADSGSAAAGGGSAAGSIAGAGASAGTGSSTGVGSGSGAGAATGTGSSPGTGGSGPGPGAGAGSSSSSSSSSSFSSSSSSGAGAGTGAGSGAGKKKSASNLWWIIPTFLVISAGIAVAVYFLCFNEAAADDIDASIDLID